MESNFGKLDLSISNIVIDYIIEKIFIGKYKSGEKIIEREIADTLKISRSPVREAIKILQQQGLLNYSPRKGCTVAFKSENEIKEIFDIRCLLENSIIETLVKEDILVDEDFDNIDEIIKEMDKIAYSDDDISKKVYDMSKQDIKFHQYLWKKSNKNLHIKILHDLYLNLQLAMIVDTNINPNLMYTALEHKLISNSLKAKNIESAKNNLKKHIISYREL